MFKKAIIVALTSLVVGCSVTSVGPVNYVKTDLDGLQNFNIAENKSITVMDKKLPFLVFHKKTEKISREDNKKFKDTLNEFGSGVQWNEDYVVTAKHVAFVKNSAYKCGEGCDLQFVKRKAFAGVPSWRAVVALEQLTFVGTDQLSQLQQKTGFDIDKTAVTTVNRAIPVRLVSTPTVVGMSGGPAYAKDGSVVGILTGSVTDSKSTEFAVMIPYEVIQSEWLKFQATQMQAAK